MNKQKALIIAALVVLAALAIILGGTPLSDKVVVLSQAPTERPAVTPAVLSEKNARKMPPGADLLPALAQATLAPQTPVDAAVQEAFLKAVSEKRQSVLGFLLYEPVVDSIHYSADGATALIWIALRDPETKQIVASEPGISIARNPTLSSPDAASSWSITFQSEVDFNKQLESLPAELLTEDLRNRFLVPQNQTLLAAGPLTGYKLPWTAGEAKKVTNSIGHYLTVSGGLASCPATCQYAFDFADGTMFPMLAAKSGIVQAVRTTCDNGSTTCTNYLILRDESTLPTTYQVYYHMARDTVPQRLRVPETPVEQGEYIGNADDTGASTGHHLHFHVYATKTQLDYSWGYSVDISFADVADNGGRPRTCSEAAEYPGLGSECQAGNAYTSGNTPRHPPSGAMYEPADRTLVTANTLRVSGTASDDIGISHIYVMANYDGSWKVIDDVSPTGGDWSKDVDLCAANVPDGPFGLTVRIFDVEGSRVPNIPVRQIIKNFACGSGVSIPPPPVCTPNGNQVALYSEPEYRGDCQLFGLNDVSGTAYTAGQFGSLKDNKASSIQVGQNVRAILYDRSEDATAVVVNGRSETFEYSDASLSDNRVGIGMASGVFLEPRNMPPDEPFFHAPIGNAAAPGTNPTSADSLVLSWEGGGGGTSFNVNLSGPGTSISTNVVENSISVGSLFPGNYSLSVKAVNGAGGNTTSKDFTVLPGSLPNNTAVLAPYSENFETSSGSWAATGLWRYDSITVDNETTKAWINNNGTDYNSSTWRAGDLTSPPIIIPLNGDYFLHFYYYVTVENGNSHWDQRWVQVSVDGAPFTNLMQLVDDRQEVPSWLNTGAVPLRSMNGKTIRVRFHFDTIDEDYNSGLGWVVDDVSVDTTGDDYSCADDGSTIPLAMNTTISSVICPKGDFDYYRISTVAGQPFKVDIDARSLNPASSLDSIIYLYGSDATSELAENDDEKYGVVMDSLLTYVPARTGTYYVKVKPWNYPGKGGPDFFYNISLLPVAAGQVPRAVRILNPVDRSIVSTMPFEISASAVDYDGGPVAKMEFFWHGSDWSQPNWTKVGTDTNADDGWTVIIDPLRYGEVTGGALYVQATGQTGGVRSAVMWDLHADDIPPVSQMAPLPSIMRSTAFKVYWSGSDVSNDIERYNLQYQINGGPWYDWSVPYFPASVHSTWAMGGPGATFGFRVRAVDSLGNTESYPAGAQAVTTVESSCAPDGGEVPGQARSNASPLPFGSLSGAYNLCKSASAGAGANDEDWFTFTSPAGKPWMVIAFNQGGGAQLSINLYDANGGALGSWLSAAPDLPVTAKLSVPASGTYYLKVSSANGSVFGTDVKYNLWAGAGSPIFLPAIRR